MDTLSHAGPDIIQIKKDSFAGKKVVFLASGTTAPYSISLNETITHTMISAGVDYTLFDAAWDITKQINQMDDALSLKTDLIIIHCVDANKISLALRKAYDKRAVIVAIHNPVLQENKKYIAAYAGNDSKTEAILAAELINDALGASGGKLAIIEGDPSYEPCKWRTDFFKERLDELNKNIRYIAKQYSHWSKEESTKIMENWLFDIPDLKGVYAHDDSSLAGAIIAMKKAGIEKGSIKTIGVGCNKDALNSIQNGWQYGTVSQIPSEEGKTTCKIAFKILEMGLQTGQHLNPFNNPMNHEKVTILNVTKFLPGEW